MDACVAPPRPQSPWSSYGLFLVLLVLLFAAIACNCAGGSRSTKASNKYAPGAIQAGGGGPKFLTNPGSEAVSNLGFDLS